MYTYHIPDTMTLHEGCFLTVPIGSQTVEGLAIHIRSGYDTSCKSIVSVCDTKLPLPAYLCQLILWLAHTYLITPYKAFQTIAAYPNPVPPSSKKNSPPTSPSYTLTPDQGHVLQALLHAKPGEEHLLLGVTSSGKTELYMQLSQHMIDQGKQSIILVPEIALTPQFYQQFDKRFGPQISIIHSGLSPKKRAQSWQEIYRGEKSIIIGTRSAIFSPCSHLGLIILDEEHDFSYKQDQDPRYFTHDIAKFRANYHQCPLILGSATPSLGSYIANQASQSIHYLPNRIENRPLPTIRLVDMSDPLHPPDSFLSYPLRDSISQNFQKKEKTLLLLNRRGYAPYIICRHCQHIHACPNCMLSFTYHRDHFFRCHRCHTQVPVTHRCNHCHKPRLAFEGSGIQKLEIELHKYFPDAHVIRLDKDTGKTPKKIESLLEEFKEKGDILIGTQLIAKGHHIDSITLVGVIGIDAVLNIPDYSSCERVFQLLSQVAGRSGRGEKPGHVIVQTRHTHHYAIQCAQKHDTKGFLEKEATFRRELNYPPFCDLVHIIFSSVSLANAKTTATLLTTFLKESLQTEWDDFQVLGPCPAPIEKIRDHYRWHLLIKTPAHCLPKIKEVLASYKKPLHTRVLFDFSPKTVL